MWWMNECRDNALLIAGEVQAEVEQPLYKCASHWGWLDNFSGSFPSGESLRFCESVILGSPLTGKQILPPWVTHRLPRSQVFWLLTHPLKDPFSGSAGSLILQHKERLCWKSLGAAAWGSKGAQVIGSSVAPLRSFTRLRFALKISPQGFLKSF